MSREKKGHLRGKLRLMDDQDPDGPKGTVLDFCGQMITRANGLSPSSKKKGKVKRVPNLAVMNLLSSQQNGVL